MVKISWQWCFLSQIQNFVHRKSVKNDIFTKDLKTSWADQSQLEISFPIYDCFYKSKMVVINPKWLLNINWAWFIVIVCKFWSKSIETWLRYKLFNIMKPTMAYHTGLSSWPSVAKKGIITINLKKIKSNMLFLFCVCVF